MTVKHHQQTRDFKLRISGNTVQFDIRNSFTHLRWITQLQFAFTFLTFEFTTVKWRHRLTVSFFFFKHYALTVLFQTFETLCLTFPATIICFPKWKIFTKFSASLFWHERILLLWMCDCLLCFFVYVLLVGFYCELRWLCVSVAILQYYYDMNEC